MGRHCQSYCKICMKTMRKDNLQRHLKMHDKHSPKSEEYISQKCIGSDNGNNQNSCKEETISFISDEHTLVDKSSKYSKGDDEGLRKTLRKCNEDYKEKINLGAKIYIIVAEDCISEENIPQEYKKFLNLFVKQKQFIDKKKCNS